MEEKEAQLPPTMAADVILGLAVLEIRNVDVRSFVELADGDDAIIGAIDGFEVSISVLGQPLSCKTCLWSTPLSRHVLESGN